MKRFVHMIFALTIFSSFFCEKNDQKSIRYGTDLTYADLNPLNEFSFEENLIKRQIFEPLLLLDTNNEIKSHLVEKWEEIEKGQTYRFVLKDGIRFHNGSKLSSHSVYYSFQQLVEQNHKNILTKLVRKIQIQDSLTFTIKLKRPYSPFLFALTSPFYLLISSENSHTNQDTTYKLIGTGPYSVSKNIRGKYIHLIRFDEYWSTENFNVADIYFVYGTQREFLEEQLQSGNIDILYLIRGNQIDRLRWQGKINYHVQKPISTFFIGFNNQNKPFDKKNVRQAMNYALDLGKIVINLNRGNAVLAECPLPPVYDILINSENKLYNPELTKKMLDKIGINIPFSIRFFYPVPAFSRRTLVEAIKVAFEKINTKLEVTDFDTWEEHDKAIKSDSAQMFIDAYSAEVLGDPANFLYSLFHSQSKKNTLHYENLNVDRMLDQALLESDKNVRELIYTKILEEISHDIPAIFLYHVKPHYAYRTEKIKKLVVDPYGIIQFHKTELN